MSSHAPPKVGTIAWCDLTVPDAEALRDFYTRVTGWEATPLDMGGFSDYVMSPAGSSEGIAGICHARGVNADIPPQWLVYIVVHDVGQSAIACRETGGTVLVEPRPLSGGRFCIIQDPAGAVCALFQPPAT